jgi:hypothetical protein
MCYVFVSVKTPFWPLFRRNETSELHVFFIGDCQRSFLTPLSQKWIFWAHMCQGPLFDHFLQDNEALSLIEAVCIAWFTLEYVLRLGRKWTLNILVDNKVKNNSWPLDLNPLNRHNFHSLASINFASYWSTDQGETIVKKLGQPNTKPTLSCQENQTIGYYNIKQNQTKRIRPILTWSGSGSGNVKVIKNFKGKKHFSYMYFIKHLELGQIRSRFW